MKEITVIGGTRRRILPIDLSKEVVYFMPTGRDRTMDIQIQSDTLTANVGLKYRVFTEGMDKDITNWADVLDSAGNAVVLALVLGAKPVMENIGNVGEDLIFGFDFGSIVDVVNIALTSK